MRLFQGKAKPSVTYVGTSNQPHYYEDKFGKVQEGNIRSCQIATRWGHLNVPRKWMNKRLRIIVEEKNA